MLVSMITIEWGHDGHQVRRDSYKIRAHKEPVMPERFQPVRDGVWQEQRRGDASLRLTTWIVTGNLPTSDVAEAHNG